MYTRKVRVAGRKAITMTSIMITNTNAITEKLANLHQTDMTTTDLTNHTPVDNLKKTTHLPTMKTTNLRVEAKIATTTTTRLTHILFNKDSFLILNIPLKIVKLNSDSTSWRERPVCIRYTIRALTQHNRDI
jgi:hypothetical protein